MICTLNRYVTFAFLVTALLYLSCLTYLSYPLTTLLKPLPIFCLMIGVWQSNLMPWAGRLLTCALIFSVFGDIVLTLPLEKGLELGIGGFLLAHCCYIVLFLKDYQFRLTHFMCYLPVLFVAGFAAFLLIPHLGALLIPVIIYLGILLLMVFFAFQVKHQGGLIAFGALIFFLSDLMLAFYLFAPPAVDLRIAIMAAYYSAQCLLISGLIIAHKRGM